MFNDMNYIFNIYWVKAYLLPIIDISIIAYLIYTIYNMIAGTRAIQVVKGLALIIFVTWLSQLLRLETLHWILNHLIQVVVIAVLILFQPELRRMLTKIGQNRFVGAFFKETINVVDIFTSSVEELSNKKIGAIVVLEANVGLKNYIETGINIDAILSKDLLISIFKKESPLHDGAVIVRRERIIAAKCILPLTEQNERLEGYGTRHRAALGIAEETDAFIIVVSEETGKTSVAWNSNIEMGLSIKHLEKKLKQHLLRKS